MSYSPDLPERAAGPSTGVARSRALGHSGLLHSPPGAARHRDWVAFPCEAREWENRDDPNFKSSLSDIAKDGKLQTPCCSERCEQPRLGMKLGLDLSLLPGAGMAGGPGWSSPDRADAPRSVSHGVGTAAPAAGRDLCPAPLESQTRGRGGPASGGLKWPRSAAGVGCAMRQGLTPPNGMLGKGEAIGTGRGGRAAAGSAPRQPAKLQNALCVSLGTGSSENGAWRGGVPLLWALNFWVSALVFLHLLLPEGRTPSLPRVPPRGTRTLGPCSWGFSELTSQGFEKRNHVDFGLKNMEVQVLLNIKYKL